MNRSNRHHIQFRYGLITLLILLFSAAISYKLFSTTVIDAPKWNEKARRQLEKVDTIMPERGDILSDKGQILATNLRYYTVRIDFRCDNFKQNAYLENIDALADSMAAAFPIRTRQAWQACSTAAQGASARMAADNAHQLSRPAAAQKLSVLQYRQRQQDGHDRGIGDTPFESLRSHGAPLGRRCGPDG